MTCLHTESLIPSEEFDAALAEIESQEADARAAVAPETVGEAQDESPEPVPDAEPVPEPEPDDQPVAASPPTAPIETPPESDADDEPSDAADAPPASEAEAPPPAAADAEPATPTEEAADETAPPAEPVGEADIPAPDEPRSADDDLSAAFEAIEQGGPAPTPQKPAGINVKIKKNEPAPPVARVKIKKKMRLTIGDQKLGGAGAAQGSNESPSPASRGELVIPATPIGKRIYRTIDAALRWLDRPFSRIDPAVKSVIGRVALTSIVVSILLMVLVPLIFPDHDAIMFLEEKIAALPEPAPHRDAPQVRPEAVPFTP